MLRFSKVILSIFSVLMYYSCTEVDTGAIDLAFNHGVFIVNEGNFTDSDGSLSFYDKDSLTITNKVFENINSRPFAGLMQSALMAGGFIFLVDQNGRIEVMDAETLISLHVIEDNLSIPRYLAVVNDQLYVSDWGPYDENFANPTSHIKVYSLNGFAFLEQVPTASRPEGLMVSGEQLYVANSAENVVSVYNTRDNGLIGTIETNHGPTHFVRDHEGDAWVVSTGAYITGGALQEINPDTREVVKTIDLADYSPNGRISIDGSGQTIYFLGEKWAADFSYTETAIYATGVSGGDMISTVVSGRNFYGMGIDPESEVLYVANHEGFQGNGTVYRYQTDGAPIDNFKVGRGPREFVFVNP